MGVGGVGEASVPLSLPKHMMQMGACSSGVQTMATGASHPGHWELAFGLLCFHCFQMIGIYLADSRSVCV